MRTALSAAILASVLTYANALAGEPGQPAPACDLTAFGGSQPFDMRQFRGKVLYVDFWASWCSSCAKSFPFMNALDKEFRDNGLQVVGINLDDDMASARAFLEKRPASFALAADATGQCPRNFGVTAMPSSYLVDREGTIRHVFIGFRSGESERVRAMVEQLVAEQSASTAGDDQRQ
jgi:peroxiredoxin